MNTDKSFTFNPETCLLIYQVLANISNDMFVIFDFEYKICQYINTKHLKASKKSFKNIRFDELKTMVHPDDFLLIENVYKKITEYTNNEMEFTDSVNYFSFLLRVKNYHSVSKVPNYFMSYVKIKPLLFNGKCRYGICLLSAAIVRKQNGLLLKHYENQDYSVFSFEKKKWEYHKYIPLSNRQKEMLAWAQRGFTLKETADKMNISTKTIENMRSVLYEKFGVNSIEQAIQYVLNRKLTY